MKYICITFMVILFLSLLGCVQKHLYVMPAAHTHLMSKANEVQMEVHAGDSWNFQAAWSPIYQFSIYSAYANTNKLNIDHSYRDLAMGTYFNMDSINIEILAGFGSGKAITTYDSEPEKIFNIYHILTQLNGKYTRSFFQINAGYLKGLISSGMAFRLSHVHFNELKRTTGSKSELLKNVSENYFEPSGFIRFGCNRFGIKTQIGYPIRIGPEESSFDAFPYHISLGLYLKFGGK